MCIKKALLIILFFLSCQFVFSQNIVISGRVVDQASKSGLSGVTVKIDNEQAISDTNGNFQLTAQFGVVKEIGITLSYVGYLKKHVPYAADGIYHIELVSTAYTLSEVSIQGIAETVMEKAIRKIPENYPDRAFMMGGILRTHHINKDSVNTYEYFQNDAILKIYHPAYSRRNDPPQISVIQNKYKIFKPLEHHSGPQLWVNAYLVPGKDFVYLQEDFISRSKMKQFDYVIKGKAKRYGYSVYIVDFSSKKKTITGTLYIDESTYAFVSARYTHNYDGVFRNTMVKNVKEVVYKKIGDKWFLNNISSKNNYKDPRYTYTIDFKMVSIDTVTVKQLKSNVVIKAYTDDVDIHEAGNDTTWNAYKQVFNEAEKDNLITNISPPNNFIDQSAMAAKSSKSFFKSLLGYLVKDNLRYVIKFSRLPLTFDNYQPALGKSISSSSIYTFGSNLQLRLYKGLFFEIGNSTNYGLGGIRNEVNEYYLTYNFELNRHYHPITISPVLGYSKFSSSNKKITRYNQENFTSGLNVAYEIGRRYSFYVGGNYNLSSKGTNNGLLLGTQKVYPFSGIIYKIK